MSNGRNLRSEYSDFDHRVLQILPLNIYGLKTGDEVSLDSDQSTACSRYERTSMPKREVAALDSLSFQRLAWDKRGLEVSERILDTRIFDLIAVRLGYTHNRKTPFIERGSPL